jgi:hypothetical protein
MTTDNNDPVSLIQVQESPPNQRCSIRSPHLCRELVVCGELSALLIEAADQIAEQIAVHAESYRVSGEPLRFYRQQDQDEYDRLVELERRLREAAQE